jgi:hypothetical protein
VGCRLGNRLFGQRCPFSTRERRGVRVLVLRSGGVMGVGVLACIGGVEYVCGCRNFRRASTPTPMTPPPRSTSTRTPSHMLFGKKPNKGEVCFRQTWLTIEMGEGRRQRVSATCDFSARVFGPSPDQPTFLVRSGFFHPDRALGSLSPDVT